MGSPSTANELDWVTADRGCQLECIAVSIDDVVVCDVTQTVNCRISQNREFESGDVFAVRPVVTRHAGELVTVLVDRTEFLLVLCQGAIIPAIVVWVVVVVIILRNTVSF